MDNAYYEGMKVTELDRSETLTLVRFPDGFLDWVKTNEIEYK
ncbi:hypothetical protein [Bacillus toyonensis]|nr:hypothetical protein [Bacillus toyonensis]